MQRAMSRQFRKQIDVGISVEARTNLQLENPKSLAAAISSSPTSGCDRCPIRISPRLLPRRTTPMCDKNSMTANLFSFELPSTVVRECGAVALTQ
jgi:hypothetical protein